MGNLEEQTNAAMAECTNYFPNSHCSRAFSEIMDRKKTMKMLAAVALVLAGFPSVSSGWSALTDQLSRSVAGQPRQPGEQ